jgi:hypothetical protein
LDDDVDRELQHLAYVSFQVPAAFTSSVCCSNASMAFRYTRDGGPIAGGNLSDTAELLRAGYIRNLDKPHNRIISAGAEISTGIT